jgi:hypothetical protein
MLHRHLSVRDVLGAVDQSQLVGLREGSPHIDSDRTHFTRRTNPQPTGRSMNDH